MIFFNTLENLGPNQHRIYKLPGLNLNCFEALQYLFFFCFSGDEGSEDEDGDEEDDGYGEDEVRSRLSHLKSFVKECLYNFIHYTFWSSNGCNIFYAKLT